MTDGKSRLNYWQSVPLGRNNQRLLRLMTKRVGVALRLQRDKGGVRSEQGPGQYQLWEIER